MTSSEPDARTRLLVRSQLEPGVGWVWVRARCAQDIKKRYPSLEVAHSTPSLLPSYAPFGLWLHQG